MSNFKISDRDRTFEYFYKTFHQCIRLNLEGWALSALNCMKSMGYTNDYNAGLVETCEEIYSEKYGN